MYAVADYEASSNRMSFHELLRNIRKDKHITQKSLCTGLCSCATLSRIERGEIGASKVLRDRLLGRVGVSLDGFEEYLQPGEYEIWRLRHNALRAYANGDADELSNAIQLYRQAVGDNHPIAMQLVCVLEACVLRLQNGTREQLHKIYKKALLLTTPSVELNELLAIHLSIQEISIVLDYIDSFPKGMAQSHTGPMLERILCYIDELSMEEELFAKIYTKTLHLYLKNEAAHKTDREDGMVLLNLCERAIDLLRNTGKSYYLVELLGYYEELLFRFLKDKTSTSDTKKTVKEKYFFAKNMKQCMLGVYKRYHMNAYMRNDAYLYDETDINRIGDVIHKRRIMLGYSRQKLAENTTCSMKTIYRAEKGDVNIHDTDFRDIFQALGLPAEYIVRELITSRAEVFRWMEKKKKANHNKRYGEEYKAVKRIEQKLSSDSLHNIQYLMCWNTFLAFRMGTIGADEFFDKMQEAVHLTIPGALGRKANSIFLTKMEMMCIYILVVEGIRTGIDCGEYTRLLESFFRQIEEEGTEENHIQKYELVMTALASIYGNRGHFDMSDNISRKIIEICLQKRRLVHLVTNIYNLSWNASQTENGHSSPADSDFSERLKECICISGFCHLHATESFFRKIARSVH